MAMRRRIRSVFVTALPPEGASFSNCRGSLTRAQPGPGRDIQCSVRIRVDHAVNWTNDDILVRARASASAQVTADARPSRVHEHHSPASFRRFAGKDAGELRPARVKDRLVQPGLSASLVRKERPGLPDQGVVSLSTERTAPRRRCSSYACAMPRGAPAALRYTGHNGRPAAVPHGSPGAASGMRGTYRLVSPSPARFIGAGRDPGDWRLARPLATLRPGTGISAPSR